jgi:hypothetical protein
MAIPAMTVAAAYVTATPLCRRHAGSPRMTALNARVPPQEGHGMPVTDLSGHGIALTALATTPPLPTIAPATNGASPAATRPIASLSPDPPNVVVCRPDGDLGEVIVLIGIAGESRQGVNGSPLSARSGIRWRQEWPEPGSCRLPPAPKPQDGQPMIRPGRGSPGASGGRHSSRSPTASGPAGEGSPGGPSG